jgi:hypothetical protein
MVRSGFNERAIRNRAFHLGLACVRPKMHVAQDDDAKSMECFRQTPQANANPLRDGCMRLDQETIHCRGSP